MANPSLISGNVFALTTSVDPFWLPCLLTQSSDTSLAPRRLVHRALGEVSNHEKSESLTLYHTIHSYLRANGTDVIQLDDKL